MIDLTFDTIYNDLLIASNGDFATVDDASGQNAQLILLKSAVSISAPQFGVAAEERIDNITQSGVNSLCSQAQSQILADGAQEITIIAEPNNQGLYEFQIQCKY